MSNPFKLVPNCFECVFDEFENMVNEHFNLSYDWSLTADQLSSNDSIWGFDITIQDLTEPLDQWEQEYIDRLAKEQTEYAAHSIVHKLALDGVLGVGSYYVNVSW